MVIILVLCQIAPASLIAAFSHEPQVITVGTDFLRIISWNFNRNRHYFHLLRYVPGDG